MSRRVVTGLDAAGRSCVVLDVPLAPLGPMTGLTWHTETLPADNSGSADGAGRPFSPEMLQGGGSTFLVARHAPGGRSQAYWHAIDALAYVVVLKGEMVLALETSEVRLKAGDFIANRGVMHAWFNDGPDEAEMAVVTIPALPAGKGRTI
jgi:mannose-6-phosphate isomerase-like protein (cupin superfamily)